nr:immunoglobulin light chain junction region [Macaca mulatta]
CRHYYSSPSSF